MQSARWQFWLRFQKCIGISIALLGLTGCGLWFVQESWTEFDELIDAMIYIEDGSVSQEGDYLTAVLRVGGSSLKERIMLNCDKNQAKVIESARVGTEWWQSEEQDWGFINPNWCDRLQEEFTRSELHESN